MKDEEIIKFFSLSLEGAILFPDQYSQYCLYQKHL